MLKEIFLIIAGVFFISLISLASPYTAPTYDAVNFSLCTGYTAPTYDSINFTLGESDSCITDSCTYTSGNWAINCNDNCSISSPVDVGGNNITIIGTGTFFTSEDITGYDKLHIEGTDSSNICRVTCVGGCFR